MNQSESPTTTTRSLTPLTVISLFLGLTETVLTVAVTQTSGNIQLALTIFVMAFPVFVATLFFAILWHRPHHFYAPAEYGEKFGVREFAEAINRGKVAEYNKIPISEGGAVKLEETQYQLQSSEVQHDEGQVEQ